MAKRGRCRCGTLLVFQQKEEGYKTRCPVCQSVVRLRADAASKPSPPALPGPRTVPPPLSTSVDLSVLETNETTVPPAEVEMEAYHEPVSVSLLGRHGWWFFPLAVGVAVAALAALAVFLR